MKLLAPYMTVLRKYVVFDGRSTRTEYWGFVAVNVAIAVAFNMILGVLQHLGRYDVPMSPTILSALAVLGNIYFWATLVPYLAVGARRLHDTNRSGWWLLLNVLAIAFAILGLFIFVLAIFGLGFGGSSDGVFGALLLVALGLLLAGAAAFITFLVFMVLPGNDGPNKYGDKPEWPEIPA